MGTDSSEHAHAKEAPRFCEGPIGSIDDVTEEVREDPKYSKAREIIKNSKDLPGPLTVEGAGINRKTYALWITEGTP